jgi:hypothetical protein
MGVARVPGGGRILELGRDYALILQLDALGEPTVELRGADLGALVPSRE